MAFHPYVKTPHAAQPASWKVPDLYAAYGGPSGLSGRGKIGILEMGGQYSASDMTKFCQILGIPEPTVENPDGPFPSDPSGADVEVNLDAQIAHAIFYEATGEPATLVFIWEASDQAAAVQAAKSAGCATFSCSWGEDESDYGESALKATDAACQAALPMLVFAAAGDNDSSDGVPGQAANIDGPASCPHVVAVGGTSKPHSGPEVVWNNDPGKASGEGTGGGISTVFPLPSWQVNEPHPPTGASAGRGVPDVALCADPDTGYVVVSGGQEQVVGGTSCGAPFLAGFFAALPPASDASQLIWENEAAFNDIVTGNNGAYDALVGPDYCSGVGSPRLSELARVFGAPGLAPTPVPTPTPTPTPTPVPTPTPTPPGQPDEVQLAVEQLQQALIARRYTLKPTGRMDIHTIADTLQWQRRHPTV